MITVSIIFLYFITNLPALFSIRFDEYYDSDGLPEYGLDDYPCFQIGAKCSVSIECCGVACCVLPSWSPSPVCLVPGYKEDLRLVKMFGQKHPSRDDVLFARKEYNTTYFNSFLKDDINSTSHAVDNDAAASTSKGEHLNATGMNNVLINNSSIDTVNGRKSEDFKWMNEKNLNTNTTFNVSTEFEQKFFNDSSKPVDLKREDDILKENSYEKGQFSNLLKSIELEKTLLKHYGFLLLDGKVENTPTTNLSEIYERIKNVDQFKLIVKLLQDKLKSLHEQEIKQGLNFTVDRSFSELQTTFATTEVPSTTQKVSKWDLVRNLFLHGNDKLNKTNNHSKELINFAEDQEELIANDEDKVNTDSLQEIMKELFHDSDEIMNSENTKEVNDDVMEVFNINIPYNVDENNDSSKKKQQSSLEKTFTTLTQAIYSYDPIQYSNKAFTKKLDSPYEQHTKNQSDETKIDIRYHVKNSTKPKHLWSKIYLWPMRGNSSCKLTKKLKNIFHWRRKTNISDDKQRVKPIILNERFLFTLNSRNRSHQLLNVAVESPTAKKKIPDYPSESSSSESASSDMEDLYNNSIVFVMKKHNSSGFEKYSRWKTLLNFFHISGVLPCPKNTNPCIDPSTGTCRFAQNKETVEKSASSTAKPVHKIITLPQSLMPEELEKTQGNNTDIWLYEDETNIAEDNTIEQHSSNNTFLFFFK